MRKVVAADDGGWTVRLAGPEGEEAAARFDKVVLSTGAQTSPVWPCMSGRDKFRGIVMHSQHYRM